MPTIAVAVPLNLLHQMVGQVGREPLTPISARWAWIDAVAPPVVKNFVRVGAIENEGQAHHPWPEQRERWHTEPRFPAILDHAECRVGVRSEELLEPGDVLSAFFEIAPAQGGIGLSEKCKQPRSVAVGKLRTLIAVADEVQRPMRLLDTPPVLSQWFALANRGPSRREMDRQIGGEALANRLQQPVIGPIEIDLVGAGSFRVPFGTR